MDAEATSPHEPHGRGAHTTTTLVQACDEAPPAMLLKGIEEFNEGRYWECHETLEALWQAEPRRVRNLYQGILQVGVGFHHLQKGNYSGALKVLGRGLARLQGFPETCQGVRVAELMRAARRVHEEIRRLGQERMAEFDVSGLPRIRVDFLRPGF